MARDDTENRLSILETNHQNTAKTLDAMWTYMKESRQWRDETSVVLGVIANNQTNFKSYQEQCDKDRAEFKTFQTSHRAVTGFISAGVAVIISCLGLAATWFHK